MNLIAHRGLTNKKIKENTLEAFDNALKNGFLGFECDIRLTKDNIPVICHDPFIDRTSNGSGLIRDKTYDQLLKYNFGTKENRSKIPTLKEVLKYKCIKLIELKVDIDLTPYIDLIDDNTYFISFNNYIIKSINGNYPQLKTGLLTGIINNKNTYNYKLICLLDDTTNKEIISFFKEKGIKVFIYGIVGKLNNKDDDLFYITNKKID